MTSESRQKVVPPLRRHPTLYWEDGSLVMRTACGTLYKLTRQLLAMKSGFFAGLFDFPRPTPNPPSTAASLKALEDQKTSGLDGLTDETALELPENVDSSDFDHLLHFIFNLIPWSTDAHPLEELIAVLRLSHFFDVQSGTQYAVFHLSTHPAFTAPMRLYLAIAYDVDHWVSIAFNELMKKSILNITENDEKLIGRVAYRLLVRTHAEVNEHRTNLAFQAPTVHHGPNCSGTYTQKECVRLWEDAWFGRKGTPGMVAGLLDTRLPGAALYAVLDQFYVSGMSDGCRRRTLDSLADTPEKLSSIKKEDTIIGDAIRLLKKSM
ncbi:hypothetical protein B0H13DRAFT_2373535 [Mycena leptocephala]|nr:hypothetical protein B0H13DRAFT_2373535 [Mycena leptocephala]